MFRYFARFQVNDAGAKRLCRRTGSQRLRYGRVEELRRRGRTKRARCGNDAPARTKVCFYFRHLEVVQRWDTTVDRIGGRPPRVCLPQDYRRRCVQPFKTTVFHIRGSEAR